MPFGEERFYLQRCLERIACGVELLPDAINDTQAEVGAFILVAYFQGLEVGLLCGIYLAGAALQLSEAYNGE